MATVKAIPPQRREPSLKKVAAYCCVSTKSQEQLDSLAAQERYYEELIKANPNWKFAGIYADIGSEITIKGRKRFNALLSACRRGKVDMGFDQISPSICAEYRGCSGNHMDV